MGNDPQWGRKKGGSGPPDLDEMLRNVNKKLNDLFGGRKRPSSNSSGDGDGDGGGNFKRFSGGLSIGVLLGLLLLLWIASGFYIVNEGQRGVVLRFGQYSETTQAGLSWHLPYPAETVELVNVSQVRTIEIGYRKNVASKVLKESLMLTDDENIIDIQFAVQYILKNPEEYLFNNRDPDEAVLQAAEFANLNEYVNQHPQGFDMMVGERGESLSGGQRKSVALARAVIHNPPIMLLDEPTGSMDHSTEVWIKRKLTEFAKGKTMLMVTHRTSLLDMADRIVVVDSGRVVADGPRDQVIEALRAGRIGRVS